MKHAIIIVLIFIAACLGMGVYLNSQKPGGERLINNALLDCPSKPLCVDTRDTGYAPIKAIPYVNSPEKAMNKVLAVLHHYTKETGESHRIVGFQDTYLHIVFTTDIVGLHDDVEFYFNEADKRIHMRAAARFGYYDFNRNEKRLQKFLEFYNTAL